MIRQYITEDQIEREIIENERGELELTLRMEDPCTTLADVRYFEGFKYV